MIITENLSMNCSWQVFNIVSFLANKYDRYYNNSPSKVADSCIVRLTIHRHCLSGRVRNLDRDIEGSAKRWKKFCESELPEKEKFPQEWKNKTALQRLCMMRALRPDRMTYAVR